MRDATKKQIGAATLELPKMRRRRKKRTTMKTMLLTAQCRISKAQSAADVDDRGDAGKFATTKALKYHCRGVASLQILTTMTTTMTTMTTMTIEMPTKMTTAVAAMPLAAVRPAATPRPPARA